MTTALTHQSASIDQIVNMVRLLAYIYEHDPTRDDVCTYLDISRATFKRYLAAARFFGADIRAVTRKNTTTYYKITKFGLFNKAVALAIASSA